MILNYSKEKIEIKGIYHSNDNWLSMKMAEQDSEMEEFFSQKNND